MKAEAVDAPHVATSRWKAVKLDCHGEEPSLKSWRTFLREYRLKRDRVEDWDEQEERARLTSLLPTKMAEKVVKEQNKQSKKYHTAKMILPKDFHKKVVAWVGRHVTASPHAKLSLRSALLITVEGGSVVACAAAPGQQRRSEWMGLQDRDHPEGAVPHDV